MTRIWIDVGSRLRLQGRATAGPSTALLRSSGRDDKGEGGASRESSQQRITQGTDVDESNLIAAARQGDQGAFAELYDLHHGYVRGICRNILRDDSVDDLCQDTFLVAFTRLDTFAGNAKFRSWITRIAVNQCLMTLRKRRQYVSISLEDDLLYRYIFITKDAVLEGAPARMDLEKMMSVLTDSTRQMLIMAYLEGIPEGEIAETLGLSVDAVRCKLSRAKRKMRDMFTAVAAS
jgi:RNA polymerase sigma-70 factor (ECF subfamily)